MILYTQMSLSHGVSMKRDRQLKRWILKEGRTSVMERCISKRAEYRMGCLQPVHGSPGAAVWDGSRPGANVHPLNEWWARDWKQREQCGKARALGGTPLQSREEKRARKLRNKGWVKGDEASCEPPLSTDTKQHVLTLFRSQGANGGLTGDFSYYQRRKRNGKIC